MPQAEEQIEPPTPPKYVCTPRRIELGTGATIQDQPSVKDINLLNIAGIPDMHVGHAREAELLPVPYFHIVFSLPAQIADIAYQNKAAIYDILFKASAET